MEGADLGDKGSDAVARYVCSALGYHHYCSAVPVERDVHGSLAIVTIIIAMMTASCEGGESSQTSDE
jgi:hypothetical protein